MVITSLLKQHRAAEQELLRVLRVAARREDDPHGVDPCPDVAELSRFVAGKYRDPHLREEMLSHLASCDRCISVLKQMRERRLVMRKVSFALAAAAVLAITVWIGFHRSERIPNDIAIIDLRAVSPTRGLEGTEGATTRVRRTRGQSRIILPVGSEGKYDCEVVQLGRSVPIQHVSGETLIEDHSVILNLPLNLARQKHGRYLLALRRNGSEWVYYPLTLD